MKEKGIEKLIIEAIEINFDFEAKTELHHVCQDLSRFSSLFSKVTENSKTFINFHSYQPITLFEDLGIEGKNLTSSITLNLQYREHKKGKGIPLYDLKIYCKGIERSLRRRAAVKDEVLWKKNVIRFEMKLKRQYLCGKNRGKVFYEQIYNEDEDCCSINTTALYHKISFRLSSTASKIRHTCNHDFRTRKFLKELVQQIDEKVPMKQNQKNLFSSYLTQIECDWIF